MLSIQVMAMERHSAEGGEILVDPNRSHGAIPGASVSAADSRGLRQVWSELGTTVQMARAALPESFRPTARPRQDGSIRWLPSIESLSCS